METNLEKEGYYGLYRRLSVFSAFDAMIFLSTWYQQDDYPDFYLTYVFVAAILISGVYAIYVMIKNKGLFNYCVSMFNQDSKKLMSALLSVLFIVVAFASFALHGEIAYIIQNILYVSSFMVLVFGLILAKVRIPQHADQE